MLKQNNKNAYLVYIMKQCKHQKEYDDSYDETIYGKSILDIYDRKKNNENNYILNFIREKNKH